MDCCFSVTSSGDISPVSYESLKTTPQLKRKIPLSLSHVMRFRLNNTFSLLIDSFNDSLEIVDQSTLNLLFNDQDALSSEVLNYFEGKFEKNSERGRKNLRQKYNSRIQALKKSQLVGFFICPTYACNLRCKYCYQQNSEKLNKKLMSPEDLRRTFNWIEQKVKNISRRPIVISLFGGEPFLPRLKPLVKEIFEFARQNKFLLSATTNGVSLDHFFDLMGIYHGYISSIGTTIDGSEEDHNKRRVSLRPTKGGFCNQIVSNINFLIKLGIHVNVSINLDSGNLASLNGFLELAAKNSWIDNPLVTLEIGRVDDRCYELNNQDILNESVLLGELMKQNELRKFPKNLKLAFIKTSLNLAERFGFSFNQRERGRTSFHYCWGTSPVDDIYYIDSDLDIFRCTYTVGKKKLAVGNIEKNLDLEPWFKHNSLDNEKCWNCPIGGYCGGGCFLSSSKDSKRQCAEELENFDYLMSKIVVPMVKAKLPVIKDNKLLSTLPN